MFLDEAFELANEHLLLCRVTVLRQYPALVVKHEPDLDGFNYLIGQLVLGGVIVAHLIQVVEALERPVRILST